MADQLNTKVSRSTQDLLDKFTQARGQKKGFVVEEAILQYIEAHKELPDEAMWSSQIKLSKSAFIAFQKDMKAPARKTKAIRELMSED